MQTAPHIRRFLGQMILVLFMVGFLYVGSLSLYQAR